MPPVFGAFRMFQRRKIQKSFTSFKKCRFDVILINTHDARAFQWQQEIFGGVLDLYSQMITEWKKAAHLHTLSHRELKLSFIVISSCPRVGVFYKFNSFTKQSLIQIQSNGRREPRVSGERSIEQIWCVRKMAIFWLHYCSIEHWETIEYFQIFIYGQFDADDECEPIGGCVQTPLRLNAWSTIRIENE